MDVQTSEETEFEIGPRAIDAYSRLSYTMWHAIAEFIDNSTQSRINYGEVIDAVLKQEGKPLIIEITHNRPNRTLTIRDNSIGMTKADLIGALKIAQPTSDSRGRSKYGMGMKTAACWIGGKWTVETCEWSSGEAWTAEIDVEAIAHHNGKVALRRGDATRDTHYTEIVISDLHRNIQKRTEENIRLYLGSMYRFDLESGRTKIFYNNEEITAPSDHEMDTDVEGKPMRRDLPSIIIGGKPVTGWIGVLKKGGRKYGGFSLFQNQRQIQGFPTAWKPSSIFGGIDEEGANNLVAQRLMGVIQLDGFNVSHTKDAILFSADEEEQLEAFLERETKDYRDYAQKRRGTRGGQGGWSKDKVRDLLSDMKKEFSSDEMKDAVDSSLLPSVETIIANNQKQVAALTEDEKITTFEVTADLKIVVSLQERSEHDPHMVLVTGAEHGTVHVIINRIHPYYSLLESTDAINECIRQYIYDAIAEYRVSKLQGRVNPDSVRRLKDTLLRVQEQAIENAAASARDGNSVEKEDQRKA
jgi:hypothetical protein